MSLIVEARPSEKKKKKSRFSPSVAAQTEQLSQGQTEDWGCNGPPGMNVSSRVTLTLLMLLIKECKQAQQNFLG